MKMNKVIYQRKLLDLLSENVGGLSDPYSILKLSDRFKDVIKNNPFADDVNAVIQIVGSIDGKAVGSVKSIPLDYCIIGRRYRTAAGCEMFVAEEYRNTQYGIKLPMIRLASTPNNFMVGASQSQMMLKVSEFIKSTIFYSPRMIMLSKSRVIVDRIFSRCFGKVVSMLLDLGLSVYWLCLRMWFLYRLRGFEYRLINHDDEDVFGEIARMARGGQDCCYEVHDERWFKWMTHNSFSKDNPNEITLVYKDGRPVAFFMTKKDFMKRLRTGVIVMFGWHHLWSGGRSKSFRNFCRHCF